MSALILRDALNFINQSKKDALLPSVISKAFHHTRIGLESLASLTIQYTHPFGVIIKPKKNLSREGLALLIARMTYLNPIIFFLLDFSEWMGASPEDNIINDNLLEKICQIDGLRSLSLPTPMHFATHDITDAGLSHVSKLWFLLKLELHHCSKITIAGLAYLRHLSALESLNLRDCWTITAGGLAHFQNLKSLKSLNLSNCSILHDAGLKYLENLNALESLNLSGCIMINGRGLEHLRNLKALKSLDLSHTSKIGNVGLAHLKNCDTLQLLNLSDSRHIDDIGLAHLKDLPVLKSLGLRSNKEITDAGLANLNVSSTLQLLDLSWCPKITKAGFIHFHNLTTLHLYGCRNFNDNVWKDLTHFRQLKRLTLPSGQVVSVSMPVLISQHNRSVINWHIISGFIMVLGIAAVALAFTVLNAATYGALGLCVLELGVTAILGGVGLFVTTAPAIKSKMTHPTVVAQP